MSANLPAASAMSASTELIKVVPFAAQSVGVFTPTLFESFLCLTFKLMELFPELQIACTCHAERGVDRGDL